MKTQNLLCLAAFALAIPAAEASTTIFSHTFNEGTGALNGTPVDGGTLMTNWVAAPVVTANGAFATGPGSATLAFTPSNGFEYTLDARIIGVTGDANWVALGFANTTSIVSSANDRFNTGTVNGTAWSLVRGTNTTFTNVSFNGTGQGVNGGTTSQNDWTSLNNNGGSYDLRILLDTTGGTGNWTATWFAKLTTDLSYTTVRATTDVLNEANFGSVGFGFSSNNTDGTLQSFSLTAVPEPSSALLGGLGALLILRRRL